MARVESRGGYNRSQYRGTENGKTYAYVDGTAVRKLAVVPAETTERRQTPSTSLSTKKNRERALQMNLGTLNKAEKDKEYVKNVVKRILIMVPTTRVKEDWKERIKDIDNYLQTSLLP